MLVKKQRSQKKVIIIGLLIALFLVVFYFIYIFILDNVVYQIELGGENQVAQIRINGEALENKGFNSLDEKTAQSTTSQIIEYALMAGLPAAIILEVLDPGIGTILELYWEPAQEITGLEYQVYRSIDDKNYELLVDSVKAQHYRDVSVEVNKKYYYQVAVVAGEQSVFSKKVTITAEDNLAPSSPINIKTVYDEKMGVITVSWEVSKDDDFSYINIYRSTKPGELGALLTKVISNNSFVDSDVLEGESYYYTLTSVDQHGNESTKSLIQTVVGRNNPFEMFSF